MYPFEFIVKGPPISHQASGKSKSSWKAKVSAEAQRKTRGAPFSSTEKLRVTITYFYEGDTPDVDNIIKPIQDALIGVAYDDDAQIVDTRSRKKDINQSYQIRGASPEILSGFSDGEPFLHIKIEVQPHSEDLE